MAWFSFSFNDFAFSFLSLLLEGVPFLLLGSLISGVVDVFVSPERIAKLLPKSGAGAILLGGLMGLIFPMCECGSVIVIRRFLKKGLPLPSAVAYMLASPIVSPIVAFSTFAAFKGQSPELMTALRLTLGYLIAVGIAFIVRTIPASKLLQPGIVGETGAPGRTGLRVAAAPTGQDFSSLIAGANFRQKLLYSVQSATADFLDVAFFLIIGAAIASVFNTAINQEIILPYATNPPLAIIVLMGLAALIALCSTTDAFIAASFASFPPQAKLAFMLFGPLYDVKLFWLYGVIFKRRAVIALGIFLFVVIAFVCWRLGVAQIWDSSRF
ncbi:MAG TPA: permease [Chthoniobacteraceae bacterium]